MASLSNKELIQIAKALVKVKKVSKSVYVGSVGCALLSKKQNLYCGISIHAACGVGTCAEHAAISSMLTAREFDIERIVAVSSAGKVIPPCGRCRELMYQINQKNYEQTKVILSKSKSLKLKQLLPNPWQNAQ